MTKFDWHQQQQTDLPTSVHWNSERESHAKKTLESNLSNNDLTSPEEQLHKLRSKNPGRLVWAHSNINSPRNKFDLLANIVKDKIDILMIFETKLDLSFPKGQFHLHGFSEPYRLDRNGNGGGILVFICEDIPCKLIRIKNENRRILRWTKPKEKKMALMLLLQS